MKHYKSVEFLSIFEVSSPPAQTQSPPIENFLATVVVDTISLSRQNKSRRCQVWCFIRSGGYSIKIYRIGEDMNHKQPDRCNLITKSVQIHELAATCISCLLTIQKCVIRYMMLEEKIPTEIRTGKNIGEKHKSVDINSNTH